MKSILNFMSRLLDLESVGAEVDTILRTWIGPIALAISGVGVIYIIILGVQLIKAENDSKRAEAKSRIVNCIIGVISLMVVWAVCTWVNWASFVLLFDYAGN